MHTNLCIQIYAYKFMHTNLLIQFMHTNFAIASKVKVCNFTVIVNIG